MDERGVLGSYVLFSEVFRGWIERDGNIASSRGVGDGDWGGHENPK